MIRTIRAHSALVFCALWLWIPAAAYAGGGSTVVNDVRVTVASDWSNGQLKGYQPVRLELVNESNSPRRVRILFESSYSSGDSVSQSFALDARGRLTAEVIVPTFALDNLNRWNREWSLQAQSGGETRHIGSICGEAGQSGKSAMVFTNGRLDPGEREAWASLLAGNLTEEEETLAGMRHANQGNVARVPEGLVSAFDLGASLHEFMPSRHDAYTSLDCAIVDLSHGTPPFEKLEPLLTYVRLGGSVAFLGVDAVEKASQHELLAPWMEERFEVQKSGIAHPAFRTFACGLGALLVGDTSEELLELPGTQRALRSLILMQEGFVPMGMRTRYFPTVDIPGVEKLPYKVFVALLILFAIIIGPVNFILVRRSGKPALLLLTIPAISFVASVLLLSYGVLYQGIDTKSSSITLAFLDQRSERVSVIEDRHCFVGLATEAGLRPAAGTVCFPVSVSNEDARFTIDVDGPNVLAGAFFQSRQDMHQRLFSERSSRLRLTVEKSGEGYRVTNGFTCGVSKLLIRDEQSRFWYSDGPLRQGESVELKASSAADGPGEREKVFTRAFADDLIPRSEGLAPGTYCAVLDENIFQDECGLDMNELAGRHGVMGVLDLGDFR